jgi:hypothetical protein
VRRYKVNGALCNDNIQYIGGVGTYDIFWQPTPIERVYVKWADAWGCICMISAADIAGRDPDPAPLEHINSRLKARSGPQMGQHEYEVLVAVCALMVPIVRGQQVRL